MTKTKGLPLEGIRVLEFTTAWAGPVCAVMLSDMGAEVIKIENPELPDLSRRFPPFAEGKSGLDRSGYFAILNRGKRCWALDLKKPENKEAVKRLASTSDVVVQNFAPGVLDKLGLGYEALKEVKPDIIMVSLSGYGATGPNKNGLAFGQLLEPYVGLSPLVGKPGDPPFGCGFPISDQTSAVTAAFAVLAALHHRDLTGEGEHIDISEVETLLCCMPEAVMEYTMNHKEPEPQGNRHVSAAPQGCYHCKGVDKWVAIAIGSDEEWAAFCAAIGRKDLVNNKQFQDGFSRSKNHDELDRVISEWTRQNDMLDIMKQLQKAGVCCGPVYNAEDIYNDPQLRDRGYFVKIAHPVVGERYIPGLFAKLTETPGKIRDRDHLLGEDNDWILHELLGE